MRPISFAAAFAAALACPHAAFAFQLDASFNGGGMAADYLDLGSSKADVFADAALSPTTGAVYSVGRVEHVSEGGPTFGVMFKRTAGGAKDAGFSNGSSGAGRVLFPAERSGGSSGLKAVAFDSSNTGAVLAAGFNDLANGKRCGVVYKVLDNAVKSGPLDGGFGIQGRFTYCAADNTSMDFTDLKLLPDGRALVSGNGVLASGEVYPFLLRLTTAGQLDASFNGIGVKTFDVRPGKHDWALRIAIGPQGYYVGGNAFYANRGQVWRGDDLDVWVARVTPGGALDSTFNGYGLRVEAIDLPNGDKNDQLADLALDAGARPLLLVNVNPFHVFYTPGGELDPLRKHQSMGTILRLTTAGARDASFGSGGRRDINARLGDCRFDFCEFDEPASIVAMPGNQLVVAGRHVPTGDVDGATRSQLTVLQMAADGTTSSGERMSTWPRSEGDVVLRQPDGKIVLGGLVRTVSSASDTDFLLLRWLAP